VQQCWGVIVARRRRALAATNSGARLSCDVLEHHAQLRESARRSVEHLVDETDLAIEYIHVAPSLRRAPKEGMPSFAHALEHGVDARMSVRRTESELWSPGRI
jgi:hypothetical protein